MESLSKYQKKRALETFSKLIVARKTGAATEEEVARLSEFGSVEVMYLELKRCGFPVWAISPDLTEDASWAEDLPKKKKAIRQQPYKKVEGEAHPLPSASNATHLFRAVIERRSKATSTISRPTKRFTKTVVSGPPEHGQKNFWMASRTRPRSERPGLFQT